MKLFLSIAAAVAIIALAVVLYLTKQGDTAQLATATGALADFSNRLDSAQAQVADRDGSILTLSNSLAEATAASLTLSNQLTDAQSTNALQAEQISGLNQQVAAAAAEKLALNQGLMDLTNQMSALTARITQTEASLARTNQDLVLANKYYALLQVRLQRDVAERTVVERKFNNLATVQAQVQNLLKNPAEAVTAESIYAGLNVEVQSNGVAHVIAPD